MKVFINDRSLNYSGAGRFQTSVLHQIMPFGNRYKKVWKSVIQVMTSLFNEYENIQNPTVKNNITIEQWFDLIKSSEYKDKILFARNCGKEDNFYNIIKKSIPAITYNFLFDKYKNNKNIKSPTGLLFIDIDNEEFDINILNKDLVFSYYKSFGGKGYSILVKVEGLTLENFNLTYNSVCDNLGILSSYDKGAKKATQYNVLSYDPNIYINFNSYIFSSVNDIKNVSPSMLIKKEETYNIEGDTNYNISDLVFTDIYRIPVPIESEYIVNWDGYDETKCFVPLHKVSDGRKRIVLSFLNNLVYNNPHITKEKALKIADTVNKKISFIPLPINVIAGMVKSIFIYKEENTLYPKISPKKRKIIFKINSKLSRGQKLEVCRKELTIKKINDSKLKLSTVIQNWNYKKEGKITIRAIVKVGKMSKKTIVKYWSEFKSQVEELNNNYKGDLKPVRIEKIKNTQIIMNKDKQPEMALNIVINDDTLLDKVTPNLNMSEAHTKEFDLNDEPETGTYTFLGDTFTVDMEGINIWNYLIKELDQYEIYSLQSEMLLNILTKPVAHYELDVAGKTVKVFSNTTIQPSFVQITLLEDEAIISPTTNADMKDGKSIKETIIIQQEASNGVVEVNNRRIL